MRKFGLAVASAAFLLVLHHGAACAGQWQEAPPPPNVSRLPVGFKYCPAPGADNRDFNSSYYAVDARTGEMSRYVDGAPRAEPYGPVDSEEKVLWVSPPISVENRYVPYPGAAPQEPPPEFRDGHARNLHAAARPGRRPQPEDRNDRGHGAKQPWWKKVLH